jgi:5-epi-alpha-selinene synthase
VERENLAWLERFGLVRDEVAIRRARGAMFGSLASRAYPTASRDGLAVAAAWATWLFLRDDVCDERDGGAGDVSRRNESQIRVLAGYAAPAAGDAFELALADIRDRMIAVGGASWMSRFVGNVQDYFEACAWEASNRARGVVPDLDTYVHMRDLTGAVRTCFDIYELVDGGPLPVEVRSAPAVREILTIGNRMICWSNDIFSVDKERAHGDFHNLVLILERSGSSPDEAMGLAAEMHDRLVDELALNEARLEKVSDRMSAAVPLLRAVKQWARANLDWSIETGRYAAPT